MVRKFLSITEASMLLGRGFGVALDRSSFIGVFFFLSLPPLPTYTCICVREWDWKKTSSGGFFLIRDIQEVSFFSIFFPPNTNTISLWSKHGGAVLCTVSALIHVCSSKYCLVSENGRRRWGWGRQKQVMLFFTVSSIFFFITELLPLCRVSKEVEDYEATADLKVRSSGGFFLVTVTLQGWIDGYVRKMGDWKWVLG